MGRHSNRQAALRRTFTHHIEIPVPSGGLGNVLSDMHGWCVEQNSHKGYAHFSRSERAPEPREWVVFAFRSAEEAEAFRAVWGG